METIIYGLLVMVVNAAILFYVVRKATKANEQIELLRELVVAMKPKEVEVKSDIALLTEERNKRIKSMMDSGVISENYASKLQLQQGWTKK